MLGFLLGTACLIGLIKVVRGGRYGCHGGYGGRGGFGYGRFRGRGGGFSRGGFGRGIFLRGILDEIEATPTQEKAIYEALSELRAKAKGARNELRDARAEVAKAMRSDSFDEVAVGGATARIESLVDTARGAAIDAFAKVHGVLDAEQRKRLADLIEQGPGSFAWGGHRGWHHSHQSHHDHHNHWGDHPYRGDVI